MKASDVKQTTVSVEHKKNDVHKGGYHKRSMDVRIHEIDVSIVSVLRLINQREEIVQRDKEKLAKHQALLISSKEKMAILTAKRDRLIEERDHPLSNEKKKELRAKRKQEEEKISQLLLTLERNGKTIDDLLDDLSYQSLKGDHKDERPSGIDGTD